MILCDLLSFGRSLGWWSWSAKEAGYELRHAAAFLADIGIGTLASEEKLELE